MTTTEPTLGGFSLRKPKLLDLFCCAGGAGAGYSQAGFDVTGVDISPQPRYPYKFIQADALEYLRDHGHEYDAIHASPPCQAFSSMKHMPDAKTHPELIEPTRDLLQELDVPWVIENVVGAPLLDSIILCGTMFGLGAAGFNLQRHRQFESNIALTAPAECNHDGPTIGIYGGHVRCRSSKYWRNTGADFPGYNKRELAVEAMGNTWWMTMNQMSEAIPPAYTHHIGKAFMKELSQEAAEIMTICASNECRETGVPATVSGRFGNEAYSTRTAYCAQCAKMGQSFGLFVPDKAAGQ